MIEKVEIDYQGLPFEIQRKLDQKAYAKYYNTLSDDSDDADDVSSHMNCQIPSNSYNSPLTFNSWYGTQVHKKYIRPFLRKYKLEKIKKAVI